MFGNLLETIKKGFMQPTNQPSVVGNVVTGKKWNQGLPRFGGEELSNRMIQNPNVISPLQAPDEQTPGMIHQQKFEQARTAQPSPPVELNVTQPPKQQVKGVSFTPTPIPQPITTNEDQAVRIAPEVEEFLENVVFPITRREGIPDAVAAGQFAAEGRLKGMGASRNNFFNIAAYDGKEDQMPVYDTDAEGVEAYARLIGRGPRYQGAMQAKGDPARMVEELKKAGYATRPDYAQFIMSTPEYKRYAPRKKIARR